MNIHQRDHLTTLIAWYIETYNCSKKNAIILIFENLLDLYSEEH